jgi:hypothetical protein
MAMRSRIVLAAATGLSNQQIALELDILNSPWGNGADRSPARD